MPRRKEPCYCGGRPVAEPIFRRSKIAELLDVSPRSVWREVRKHPTLADGVIWVQLGTGEKKKRLRGSYYARWLEEQQKVPPTALIDEKRCAARRKRSAGAA